MVISIIHVCRKNYYDKNLIKKILNNRDTKKGCRRKYYIEKYELEKKLFR